MAIKLSPEELARHPTPKAKPRKHWYEIITNVSRQQAPRCCEFLDYLDDNQVIDTTRLHPRITLRELVNIWVAAKMPSDSGELTTMSRYYQERARKECIALNLNNWVDVEKQQCITTLSDFADELLAYGAISKDTWGELATDHLGFETFIMANALQTGIKDWPKLQTQQAAAMSAYARLYPKRVYSLVHGRAVTPLT